LVGIISSSDINKSISDEVINYKDFNDQVFDFNFSGKEFTNFFQSAPLSPHIVFKNFINSEFLDKIQENINHEIKLETRKAMYNRGSTNREDFIDDNLIKLYDFLNSKPALLFLEDLTNIKGLIPDPYGIGAGIHITKNNGKLNLHRDFNYHPKLNIKRVLNLLLYLTPDWNDEYNGHFELWPENMDEEKTVKVLPNFNTCMIFRTDQKTFHGFPDPIKIPDSVTRKAIALYYYISPEQAIAERKTDTFFISRKDHSDDYEPLNRIKFIVKDMIPPIIYRLYKKVFKR
tara:strand:- start:3305 stop:4168 length:864 start_codon:yes stop_codon:yes gene_type:complete